MESIKILVTVIFVMSAICLMLGGCIIFFCDKNRPGRWTLIVTGAVGLCLAFLMNVLGVPYIEKATTEQAALEHRVFTADVITVQEKYISVGTLFRASEPYNVITDGKDTITIKVTDSIYAKYKPGDVYEHDADQKLYDKDPAPAE